MPFDTSKLVWTKQPKDFTVSENKITITTQPHTDLWQRTYYGFRNDNAPVPRRIPASKRCLPS